MIQQLQVCPIPAGVAADDHYRVEVRLQGTEEWQKLPLYAVHVDMHNVQQAAAGMFDFSGAVEVRVTAPHLSWIHSAVIRPVSKGIEPVINGKEMRFTLTEPVDVMLELNGERVRCVHLFARPMVEAPAGDQVITLEARRPGPNTTPVRALLPELEKGGKTLVFAPGLHMIDEYMFHVPSDTRVFLAPGAVVVGAFVCDGVHNVQLDGHGVVLLESFHRFSGINGIRISHSQDITIDGLTLINPPHYSVYIGGSDRITIRHLRSFSCEGWSDGIDMMSSRQVHVDSCFLRTSDDCIAIYGRRWAYNGDTRDVLVENSTLWADVAHPTIIGTHGDYEHEGNRLEDITFRNLDILEHNEYQPGYLGCMTINVGDKNIASNILYEDIRVENITHGKLFDVQVKCNPDYNPAPGRGIENVCFRNITCDCVPPVPAVIAGYEEGRCVKGVRIENVTACGQPVAVEIGNFVSNVEMIPSET